MLPLGRGARPARRPARRRRVCRYGRARRPRPAARAARAAGRVVRAPGARRAGSRRLHACRRSSNRMGFRSTARRCRRPAAGEPLSEPVPFGAIQVPAGGAPLLLMADRQTTGGYPKIATVITRRPAARRAARAGRRRARSSPARAPRRVAALIARERELLRAAPRSAAHERVRRRAATRAARPCRCERDVPLAPFTTFKVGGPADWLVEPRERRRGGRRPRSVAHAHGVPVTVLGGGSNVLVADARRPRAWSSGRAAATIARWSAATSCAPTRRSRSTASCAGRSRTGCAGLEAWAGTPGTVGGAIYGNAHFGGRPHRRSRRERAPGRPRRRRAAGVRPTGMEFGYDRSRLQQTRRGAAVGGVPRCAPGDARRAARGGARSRWRSASGRSRSTRRAPAASSRIRSRAATRVPEGIPRVGRRARRPGRAEGRSASAARACRRRTATSSSTTARRTAADIAALIERCRDDGARAVRRRRCARRSCCLGDWSAPARPAAANTCPHCSSKAATACRASSTSKATRTPRCRCWRRAC